MQIPEMKAHNAMKRFFRAFMSDRMKESGIPVSYGPFLSELSDSIGTSHKELTERVNANRSLTTRVITMLFIEGYAENRATGKEYSIFLTKKGTDAKRMVMDCMKDARDYLFSDCTEEELDTIREVGARICVKTDEYMSNRH